jgi:hypothetical protein
MTEIRCPRCQCLLAEAPPCAECGHPNDRHYPSYYCSRECHGRPVNGCACLCQAYQPSPCPDCVREARDEAAYDEHFGLSVDDRRR